MKVAVDAVVFAYKDDELYVLLIKRRFKPFENYHALPGGFIKEEETARQAVQRELKEETGLDIDYLEQLYSFTKPKRDPRERTISITYYGLINPDKYHLIAGDEAMSVDWIPVDNVVLADEKLIAFDHFHIIRYALTRLRNKIKYEPIGFELLPEKFTITELHRLYSTISGKEIDRRNFTSKVLKTNILTDTGEITQRTTAGRKGKLYCFDESKYNDLKINGFDFKL